LIRSNQTYRTLVELSQKARQVVGRLRGNHEGLVAAIDRLSPAAQDALAAGMEALADELERERSPAGGDVRLPLSN
jgi:hypothetical protein